MLDAPLRQEPGRRQVSECLMGSEGIVHPYPPLRSFQRVIVHRVSITSLEFLQLCPMWPFDVAIQLWRVRREHQEADRLLLTRHLEHPRKLTALIHLDRPHGERHLHHQRHKNVSAVCAVATRCAAITSHREITSRAVEPTARRQRSHIP